MNFTKKHIIIIIATIIFLIAIIAGMIFLISNRSLPRISPYQAIPNSSSIIVVMDNPNILVNQIKSNESYKNNYKNYGLNYDNSLMIIFDSINKILIQKNDVFINNSQIFVVFFSALNQNILLIETNKEVSTPKYYSELKKHLSKIGETNKIVYGMDEILEFHSDKFNERIYYFVNKGVLAASFSYETITKIINTQKGNNSAVFDDENFKKSNLTAGKKELANIYINFDQISNIKNKFLSENFFNNFKDLNCFSGWTEFDINISQDKIDFSGIINHVEKKNFVSIINQQTASDKNINKILSTTTTAFINIALSNISVFEEYIDSLAKISKNYDETNRTDNKFSAAGINIKKEIRSLVKSEICFALNKVDSLDIWKDAVLVIDVKSNSLANGSIKEIFDKYCKFYYLPQMFYQDSIFIDTTTYIPAFRLPENNIPELVFGSGFEKCKANFIGFYNNFMIFANSKTTIKDIVYDAILHNTLSNSIEFQKFNKEFSQKSNLFVYISSAKSISLVKKILSDSLFSNIKISNEEILNLGRFGYQINQNDNLLYNLFVIKQVEKNNNKKNLEWESKLDTLILTKPFIVKKHTDNTKEIFVQDKNFNIYLIGSNGRILWKIPLSEAIFGNVQQIDYYNNNKLQYLFSTPTKIYLIDRLGNFVKNYPIQLRSKATTAITFIKYSDKKNRIIIACEDKKIYLYNLDGSLVDGWEFKECDNIVNSEISHYEIDKNDFIVTHDDFKLYVLSRKGTEKISYNTKFQFSNNNIWLDDKSSKKKFVTTDIDGIVRFFDIYSKKQDSISFKKFSKNHGFSLYDINKDGKYEYIFTDENEITAFDQQKNVLFLKKFDEKISTKISFFDFGYNIYIGVITPETERIYLLDKNGDIIKDTPLTGQTDFSITTGFPSKNNYYLFVGGNENSLYNYRLN